MGCGNSKDLETMAEHVANISLMFKYMSQIPEYATFKYELFGFSELLKKQFGDADDVGLDAYKQIITRASKAPTACDPNDHRASIPLRTDYNFHRFDGNYYPIPDNRLDRYYNAIIGPDPLSCITLAHARAYTYAYIVSLLDALTQHGGSQGESNACPRSITVNVAIPVEIRVRNGEYFTTNGTPVNPASIGDIPVTFGTHTFLVDDDTAKTLIAGSKLSIANANANVNANVGARSEMVGEKDDQEGGGGRRKGTKKKKKGSVWVSTGRKVAVRNNGATSQKTTYRNTKTGEIRVRKMVPDKKNGGTTASYVPIPQKE